MSQENAMPLTEDSECAPFRLTLDQARDEIGDGYLELLDLARWLQSPPEPEKANKPRAQENDVVMEFRLAPSIVTRSEAELLNISIPRFAVRAYLQPAGSFVNLRRIKTLATHPLLWARREPRVGEWKAVKAEDVKPAEPTKPISQSPSQVIAGSSCIADSLLTRPDWLEDKYRLLQVMLHHSYGECAAQEKIWATPFVKHISLGGGLCAQAVCFIANALCHPFACGLFGVADITAIAHGEDTHELHLGGLTTNDIVKYFCDERVGLSASLQLIEPHPELTTGDELRTQDACDQLICVLSAYIASGFPVILPVDLALMKDGKVGSGSPIYSLAKTSSGGGMKRTPQRHAVLVVGAAVNDAGGFVINDPAMLPFVTVTSAQLHSVRIRDDDEKAPQQAIPVLPRKVCLSLSHTLHQPNGSQIIREGLFDIVETVQRHPIGYFTWPTRPGGQRFRLGRFRLFNPQDVTRDSWAKIELPPDAFKTAMNQLERCHWIWAQYRHADASDAPDTLWLWDAERDGPLSPEHDGASSYPTYEKLMNDYLVLGMEKRDNAWAVFWPRN